MSALQTYQKICTTLEYDIGLVENIDNTSTPLQRHYFSEASRQIKDIDALYFSGDVPYIYFRRLSKFDEEKVKEIHKLIWNQNRVPFLFIITPGELKIYNCYEEPARPILSDPVDSTNRLIKKINILTESLEEIKYFSKYYIDTGNIWKTDLLKNVAIDNMVDEKLLKNLSITESILHEKGLDYSTIHNILGRSLFILYLEDRKIIQENYYNKFSKNANTFFEIIDDLENIYNLFYDLNNIFNGDLFPVDNDEKQKVTEEHLKCIKQFF